MKQNTKEWIQYGSAIAMLTSAIVLALWSFYAISEVHGSVLAYVGEAIAFVAGVYGLALYAKNEIKAEMNRWTNRNGHPERDEQQDTENETT